MLSSSERVRKAAEKGEVSCICARPFRRMDMQREFRMFIYHGKLKAMSQYWLVRHFPWLEKRQEKYWNIGLKFVEKYGFAFPAEDFVMDVYISSSDHVKVLDLNEFGGKTDPLMMNDWNLDWESMTPGIHIVPPPRMVSGEVNVSF